MEDTTDLKQKNNYSLSIRFCSNGFSLLVCDESNLLLSSKRVSTSVFSLSEEEIIHLLAQQPETEVDYRNIRLICEMDNYTFIPVPIFKPENAVDFLNLQHKTAKNDRIVFKILETWNTVNVFSMPNTLNMALKQLYPQLSIEHHLSYLLSYKIKQGESGIYIWVRPKTMDVVVLKNGNLTLINSYSYQTPEDFTYFTLNIFEQLSLDTETCEVKLFNTEKLSPFRKYIQKYVKNVYCE